MIDCDHFLTIHDYLDSTLCFDGVSIGSGVNYFLYSEGYNGNCHYYLHSETGFIERNERLNESGVGVVIRDSVASGVLAKVVDVEGCYYKGKTFADLISPRDPYTAKVDGESILGTNWRGYKLEPEGDYCIKAYLNKRLVDRGYAWVRKKDIMKNYDTIDYHKVLLPNAYGTATDPFVIGKPFYCEPGAVCSVTYLVIGFGGEIKSQTEAENIISYIKTRFFRYLVSIKKKTQHNPRDVFQFVPLQDWSKAWNDAMLYQKYGLSRSEIAYIEARIRSMDSETLFEPDELIDPNLGEFDLLECGVKIGDTIIYTPVGIEVVVAENNKIEFDGELYTLANFTAKYMPRNKRSISGVCQGPKYFSYNGVSLYKMKESFLGGNK